MRNRPNRSQAEEQRQTRRTREGKYADMPRCHGGCGRPVNPASDYVSHPLTDCVDANGEEFGDLGIALCKKCGVLAQRPDLQTVKAWNAFVEAREAGLPTQVTKEKEAAFIARTDAKAKLEREAEAAQLAATEPDVFTIEIASFEPGLVARVAKASRLSLDEARAEIVETLTHAAIDRLVDLLNGLPE